MITKVSEIKVEELATYLKISEMNESETTVLTNLLNVSKSFISGCTGLPKSKYKKTDDISLDSTKTYYTQNANIFSVFIGQSFEPGIEYYEKISNYDLDDYSEFVIVVYILCEDMYDSRSLYVDNNNLNIVVETILGLHRHNLL